MTLAQRTPIPRAKPQILAVDDDPRALDLLTLLLNERYAVRATRSSTLALLSAQAHPPDLIISDVNMAGRSGYALADALKGHAATRDVPLIFVSARAHQEDKLRGFAQGAADYITKPYEGGELLARIELQLGAGRQKRLLRQKQGELEQQLALSAGIAVVWLWRRPTTPTP